MRSNRGWRFLAYGVLLLGVLLLLTGLGILLISGEVTRPAQLLLLWGGALVVAFAILEFEAFGELLRTRGVRGGGNILLRGLAVAGILIVLNLLVSRHPITRDLTVNRVNSLSPQTIKLLHSLPDRVDVTAFYTNQALGKRQASDLLNLYARESQHFILKFVDPDVHPDLATRAAIDRDGTTVFSRRDRPPERVTGATEQDFTTALIKLTRPQQPKIYFLTGHGERALEGAPGRALGAARDALTRQAYATEELLLVGKQTGVPQDAAAVIIAAPRTPLQEGEIKALREWTDAGGHLMVLGAPFEQSNLNSLLTPYGLALDGGFLIDQDRYLQQRPLDLVAVRYGDHPITRDLQGQLTVMPLGTAVVRQGQAKGIITSLWETSANSWEKTDQNTSDPSFDPRRDKRGPFSLVQVEDIPAGSGTTAGRLIVVGTADFADNEWLRLDGIGNVALFTDAVNWLAGQEQLISIPPRSSRGAGAQLPHTDANLIFFGTTIFMPLLILLTGVLVWLRRQMRI